MRTTCIALWTLTITLLAGPVAQADTLKRGGDKMGHVTRIGAGVVELGLDTVLIFSARNETMSDIDRSDTLTSFTFLGGPTIRYFVVDNLGLSLNINGVVKSSSISSEANGQTDESTNSEVGVLGTLMADYYVSLGRGMFLKPGIGAGGFFSKSSIPVATGVERTETTVGAVARAQLGLVFYTSAKFNLKAGLDVLMSFGTRSVDDDTPIDDRSVFQVDLGWNIGFGYVF